MYTRLRSSFCAFLSALLLAGIGTGCGASHTEDDGGIGADASRLDGGGVDGGRLDASRPDASRPDASRPDASRLDATGRADAAIATLCESLCETAFCGIPFGEESCVGSCDADLVDCSSAQLAALAECVGSCDSLYPCIADVSCVGGEVAQRGDECTGDADCDGVPCNPSFDVCGETCTAFEPTCPDGTGCHLIDDINGICLSLCPECAGPGCGDGQVCAVSANRVGPAIGPNVCIAPEAIATIYARTYCPPVSGSRGSSCATSADCGSLPCDPTHGLCGEPCVAETDSCPAGTSCTTNGLDVSGLCLSSCHICAGSPGTPEGICAPGFVCHHARHGSGAMGDYACVPEGSIFTAVGDPCD